jgi:hypothetical protein
MWRCDLDLTEAQQALELAAGFARWQPGDPARIFVARKFEFTRGNR